MARRESNGPEGSPPDLGEAANPREPPQAPLGRGGSRRQLLIGLAGFVLALAAMRLSEPPP